ncbi:MAG TPA: S-adenosylmethionine:tRNA ribosyltransferase-isomerase, partial [Longimicrobium sp.]
MTQPGSRTSDYDFHLPPELVAQAPAARRDASRLLVVDRATGRRSHRGFADLLEYVPAGDALVLNETRVFPARLLGRKPSGAPAEVFLLHPEGPDERTWRALVRPGGKLKPGRTVEIA